MSTHVRTLEPTVIAGHRTLLQEHGLRYLTDRTLPLSGTVVLADSGVTIPMQAYR